MRNINLPARARTYTPETLNISHEETGTTTSDHSAQAEYIEELFLNIERIKKKSKHP